MKKLFTLLLVMLAVGLGSQTYAQVFFSEDFEGTPNGTTDLPTGWTESGLSTDGIWSTGSAGDASSTYLNWPTPANDSLFAYTNDDDCNCNKSNDRMFLPTQNFGAYAGVNMTCDLFLNGGYSETGYVLASNDGGTTFDTVYVVPGGGSNWQNGINVSFNAYAGDTAVIICFAYNDAGNWAFAMGVDDVVLTGLASQEDLEIVSADAEYTKIPLTQATAMNVGGEVSNNGVSNLTDVILTGNVYSSTNGFSTPVSTVTSSATSIMAGDTVTISAGSFTPTVDAEYFFEMTVASASITDAIPSNDSARYDFEITTSQYARDDSIITIGLGVTGLGNTAILGVNYEMVAAGQVNSVTFGIGGVANGDTTEVHIWNTDATGMPTTRIDSFMYIFPTAGPDVFTVPIPGGIQLMAGTYFFGIKEFPAVNNMGLQGGDDIWLPMTNWGNINGGAFQTIESFGFPNTFLVRPNLDNGCTPTTATIDTSICDGQTFQVGGSVYDSTGTYTDILTNANGCDSTVTTNLTVNPNPTSSFTGLDTLYCVDDNPATLTGTPAGGTFSGNGVTGNMFDPSSVSVGFHNITYTYTDANGCSASSSQVTQVDNCTGIGEGIFGNISVSPNPNNGVFTLTGLEPGMGVKIYSLHGQVVYDNVVSFNEERIDLTNEATGTYFLWLKKDDQSYQLKVRID